MASENDLRQTLKLVGNEFPKAGVRVLLVGGFAVNYYGYTRSTLDVDFMVMADDISKVKEIMVKAGFTNWSIHDTVAFFQQPGASLRIDFLRVDRSTLQKLRNRSKRIKIQTSQLFRHNGGYYWTFTVANLVCRVLDCA